MSTLDRDPRIRTGSGRLVDPFNLSVNDIEPLSIMKALCQISRFTGHGKYPYTVGQHTTILTCIVPPHLRRAALVHDWAEAWFNDLASPIKHRPEMKFYRDAEHKAGLFVAECMNVTIGELQELDMYDKRIYVNEREALFPVVAERGRGDDLQPLFINPNAFRERKHRDVYKDLVKLYKINFPEMVGKK